LCMTNKSQAKSIARCIAIHRAMDGAGDLFFMHNKIALAPFVAPSSCLSHRLPHPSHL